MKKAMPLIVAIFLSTFLVVAANAAPVNASTAQKKDTRLQKHGKGSTGVRTAPKKDGTSVLERYNKRVEIKKRAAERRNAEMQKSLGSGQDTGSQ